METDSCVCGRSWQVFASLSGHAVSLCDSRYRDACFSDAFRSPAEAATQHNPFCSCVKAVKEAFVNAGVDGQHCEFETVTECDNNIKQCKPITGLEHGTCQLRHGENVWVSGNGTQQEYAGRKFRVTYVDPGEWIWVDDQFSTVTKCDRECWM